MQSEYKTKSAKMLQSKLEKEKKKSESFIDSVKEVKLLMDADAQEDTHLIANAFPHSIQSITLEQNQQNNHVKKLAEEYGSDVYTKKQIKTICMNYRLRFLPSTLYKGEVPIEAIHKLKEMIKNNEKLKHLSSSTSVLYSSNLYMLAPAEMFNIDSNTRRARHENKALREEMIRLRKLDPVLLIKLTDDKYLFVKEWGNSFSMFRRVLGALTAKLRTLETLFFLAWVLFVLASIKGAFFLHSILPNADSDSEKGDPFLFTDILIILAYAIYYGVTAVVAISWTLAATNGFVFGTYKKWNEGLFSLKKYFATEHNWNKQDINDNND